MPKKAGLKLANQFSRAIRRRKIQRTQNITERAALRLYLTIPYFVPWSGIVEQLSDEFE